MGSTNSSGPDNFHHCCEWDCVIPLYRGASGGKGSAIFSDKDGQMLNNHLFRLHT